MLRLRTVRVAPWQHIRLLVEMMLVAVVMGRVTEMILAAAGFMDVMTRKTMRVCMSMAANTVRVAAATALVAVLVCVCALRLSLEGVEH